MEIEMKHFALMIWVLLASTAGGQGLVITERPYLVITERVQAAAQDKNESLPDDGQSPVAAASRPYLVMFTGPWCSYCESWKNSELPKIKKAGMVVRIVSVDVEPPKSEWNVGGLPEFWIVDGATRKEIGRAHV